MSDVFEIKSVDNNAKDINDKELNLYHDIESIIYDEQKSAVRSIDQARVRMYWRIGKRIIEEEQSGNEKAKYGEYTLKKLGLSLTKKFGSGFSKTVLIRARKFYLIYPNGSALRNQLNWFQYRLLIEIADKDKREYYEAEAIKNNWTGRELERQINSLLYERLLLSSDKKTVLEIARSERMPEKPTDIIKDPMVLEFLGLKDSAAYHESDLESALIEHLEKFLLELGNGFTFVARQQRITLEDDEFFIDLVFYNRLLRSHVLFEIKTHKLTHADLGQLQMYVNYYDRYEKLEEENSTIGVLLCTKKNDKLVKISLPKDNQTILASKYQLVLPTEKQLLEQISEVEKEFENKT